MPPIEQSTEAVVATDPLAFPTITFMYGRVVYLVVAVEVKVTQYQFILVAEAVPILAQVLTSPYLATKVAGLVTNMVPAIVKVISLLNLAPVPLGMIHNPLV